ncbi:MAG TPA: tRNA (N6-isopentenyl adenosine(37)-C2)-methylthiotransferase MiaB [Spirochaetota bacterium]|nr:tRNA (N6-isopentenyl adenosine(37)-C2)-methylthiotransferase MiaB [Spirochaetota bacterium]
MNRTFRIETFGCQMNVGDSELIRLSLIKNGFIETGNPGDADICIYNTCSVRDNAEKRALARISTAKGIGTVKKRLIVVAGCMAQRLGEELVKKKIASIVIGPYQSPRLGEILNEFLKNKKNKLFISQDGENFAERLTPELLENRDVEPWHKWVTITHGCENFCAYCIVPYVRGKLISFPSGRILKFIKELADSGVIEITLLGQNVNQYGQDSGDIPFHKLLEKTASINGLKKINFMTSHPMDFNEETIHVINNSSNISRGIHLPMQSGSDRILSAMNRKYTKAHYYSVIEKIKKIIPDYAISTDLITGFPGETVDEFNETLEAVKKIQFDEAFMFSYSPRMGTPSYSMKETISEKEKAARLHELILIQREISLEKLKKRVNNRERVIAEKVSKKSGSEVAGKTFLNHPVVFSGDINDIGRETFVEISEVRGSTLFGRKIN